MKRFCIPPEEDGEFVARMEDVLDVYEREYDEKRPVVCLDETSKEIHAEVSEPIAAAVAMGEKPSTPMRQDYEYVRNGTAAIFMIYEPLTGRCHADTSDQRTAIDYAHRIEYLCDIIYPNAEKIVLVQDNLNTHKVGSLYQTFPPEKARRLAERLEIHFTPNHGSWLNMAEIALRVLSGQCIKGRFPSRAELDRAIAAWGKRNERTPLRTDWRFTTADARLKLKRLYPKVMPELAT